MTLRLGPDVTLYLARHGQTEANVAGRYQGWTRDTPLTKLGENQARAVGEILKRELGMAPAIACVSSPLARAQTTMRLARIAMGLPPDGFALEERIMEIGLGDWDGLTDAQAQARDPEGHARRNADKWNVPVPGGGECYADVAARMTDWAQSLTTDTFAVSHGASTRTLRGLVQGLDGAGINALDEPQGVVFRLRGGQVARLEP
jgi:probable phosphoglycerate mutase